MDNLTSISFLGTKQRYSSLLPISFSSLTPNLITLKKNLGYQIEISPLLILIDRASIFVLILITNSLSFLFGSHV